MRTLLLYLSLFFFLIIGKQTGYANHSHNHSNSVSAQTTANGQKAKWENRTESTLIIENADFDIEEDQLNSEECHASNPFHHTVTLISQWANWYDAYGYCFYGNQNLQHLKTLSVRVSANPIYLTQRVLRI